MRKLRLITGKASGKLRTAKLYGRDHLVVPVVALVEGVIQAVNSEGPELVLAEEFGRVPQGWNGRPVMMDHPVVGDDRVSANDPKILESSSMGSVFNVRVSKKKLLMDAWIDEARLSQVEGSGEVVSRLKNNETVEVSVGVYVATEETPGTFDGQRYTNIWRDIVPDHLAMLSAGTIGACSIEMGCGALRTESAAKKGDSVTTLKEKFQALMARLTPAQEKSDSDVRRALYEALFATEPAFLDVVDVFSESNQVIYCTAPEGELKTYRRGYELDGEEVSLKDDTEEVTMTTEYKSVAATAASGCGCGGTKPEEVRSAKEEVMEVSAEKKARVAAVITRLAAKSKLFTASDAALVEQWPDERIKGLEDQATELEKPVPVVEPVVAAAKPKAKTEAEYLEEAPESIRTVFAEHKANAEAKKAELISALKTAQSVYSEDDLRVMEIPALEKLSKALGSAKPKPNFEGQVPRGGNGTAEVIPPAPDMTERIRAARGIQTKQAS